MKKDKYLQIFSYLKEFSKLRSNPVRDIDNSETQYPEKIWLNDIPQDELFDNIVRADFNADNDFWIKIRKPKEPSKPEFAKLPSKIEKWVEPSSLLNEDEEPKLKETIEVEGETLNIEDFPGLQSVINEYIDKKWFDDLIDYNERLENYKKVYADYEKLNNTYKQFFRIYNRAQQFGEEYELVLGAGLLNFQRKSNGDRIYRHILTQSVEIVFEYSQSTSQIILYPNAESNLQIETDSILDLLDQFDSQDIIDAEKAAEDYIKTKEIDSVFNTWIIDDVLKIFVERLSSDGKYINDLAKPNKTELKPTISYSPALLLRKRNTRNFTALYDTILKEIEEEGDEIDIPSMNDLIGVHVDAEGVDLAKDPSNSFSANDTIFFPKEFNDEQIEIIEKARKNNKVLVQGPPGTGKSHTIANLICHLLAQGEKVLITAYTKRALEVLKDKLPDEFQDLTVNLLSSDSTSIKDLEKSVNSINDTLSQASLNDYRAEIEAKEDQLKSINKEIAEKTNRLIEIKEKSTRSRTINKNYSGTLTQIAEAIETDTEKFAWYNDTYCNINNENFYSELEEFINYSNQFKQVDFQELDLDIPEFDKLLTVDQIKEAIIIQKMFSEQNLDSQIRIISSDYQKLSENLNKLKKYYIDAADLQIDSSNDIINSYLNNNAYLWEHKIETTKQIQKKYNVEILKIVDKDVEVSYALGKSLKQYKKDAQILLDYLKEGNALSGLSLRLKKIFLPKAIKERLSFMNEVKVNGSPCDSIEEFNTVIQDICILQDIDDLSEIWHKDIPKVHSYCSKILFYTNYSGEVEKLIESIKASESFRKQIENELNYQIKPFNTEDLNTLIETTNFNQLLYKKDLLFQTIEETKKYLDNTDFHPIRLKLIEAIDNNDIHSYEYLLNKTKGLIENKLQFRKYIQLKNKIESDVPNLLALIESGDFNQSNFSSLKNALLYKNAQCQINDLLVENYDQQLIDDLIELEKKKKKTIAQLASKKAWCKVVEDLQYNRSLRHHLDAWVMAVRKIGKTGKGKRSLKFRKIAQQEMEFCKDSIPCWIMPLYKVAETIHPEKGMYDYVIIDEASQLGPDAIFLLYISKNIIIVGDDKQTSPEYVGIDSNSMIPHIKRHLEGIPYNDFYGTEFSFFDHAKLFCSGMTVLREHFRCMPEIIEFSNKNFYAPDGKGLYPLKQYSENRLNPLETVYCIEGFTEGTGSSIINEPEASMLVDKIASLIIDERYKNKTFGVISLQGNRQSNLIENALLKRIGEQEYHNRKIICGNSASFQGDERDIMFLSLITAQNHKRSALVRPEDERRFNVAVSRAKEQIWLFHSVQIEDLSNKEDLRYKLLDHFKHGNSKPRILSTPIERRIGTQPDPFDSWFEVDVYNDLISNGLSVIPQYEVAKGRYRIDMVAMFGNGTKIAIECDGDRWHGAEQYQNDLMRQKVLERCGWQFFRVRGYEYYSNRIKALEPLWNMIPQKAIDEPQIPIAQVFVMEENSNDEKSNRLVFETDQSAQTIISYQNQNNRFSEIHQRSNYVQMEMPGNEIIRYFNLYKTGIYVMTDSKPLDADYVLPIYSNQRNGFLLQGYGSGHINKVFISSMLNKRIGKEYMNGLNKNDDLCFLEIIESEKIIAIFYNESGNMLFKAHLTENISIRDQLHLQGYKVMYKDFQTIEYKTFPIEIADGISRLLYQSFNATGKPFSNKYYEAEWMIINRFTKKGTLYDLPATTQKPFQVIENENELLDYDKIVEQDVEDQVSTITKNKREKSLFNNIGLFSTVRIRFVFTNKEITVQLVKFKQQDRVNEYGAQLITISSQLGITLAGKSVGDIVKIINTDVQIEILDILDCYATSNIPTGS